MKRIITITKCAECIYCREYDNQGDFCVKEYGKRRRLPIDAFHEPPEWCPFPVYEEKNRKQTKKEVDDMIDEGIKRALWKKGKEVPDAS